MNINNLKVGMNIKNYRELCILLEIEEKQGNSKKSQMKDISRKVKLSKINYSFKVEEIYEKEIEVDKREFGNRSIYVEDVSIQLLHHLATTVEKDGTNQTFLTINTLAELTGMVNDKYLPTKRTIKEFIEENPYSLTKFDVDEFFLRTSDKIRGIIRSTLKNLEGRFLILYKNRHIIQTKTGWRITTEDEEGDIMEIKNKAITDMSLKKKIEVYYTRRSEEFYNKVNEGILRKYGWEKMYSGYLITFHSSQLEEKIKKYEREQREIEERKQSLNTKVTTYLDRTAEKKEKINRGVDEVVNSVWGEISNANKEEETDYTTLKTSRNFIDNQLILTDLLIKLPKNKNTHKPK